MNVAYLVEIHLIGLTLAVATKDSSVARSLNLRPVDFGYILGWVTTREG